MSLQQNIDQDIKSAMLSKDSTRLRGLRSEERRVGKD